MIEIANVVRIVFGFVMLAGAAVNAFFALTQPGIYDTFGDMAILPFYRNLWRSLVVPNILVFLALTVLFELTTGILLLSEGAAVKVGMGMAILFFLALVPFWWKGGAIINVVFAVIMALLLCYDYDKNIVDLITRR